MAGIVWMFSLVLVGSSLVYSLDPVCSQMNNCLQVLKDATEAHDIGNVCKSLDKGEKCVDAVNKQCPELKKLIDVEDVKLSDVEMDAGCDGKCAQAYSKCFDPLANMIKLNSTLDKKACTQLDNTFACTKKIDSKSCSVGMKKLLGKFVTSEKNKYFSKCDTCPWMEKCMEEIESAQNTFNLTSVCNALNTGENCLSSLNKTCPTLKKLVGVEDIKVEDLELDVGCDGECAKSYAGCFDTLAGAINTDKTKSKDMCNKITWAFKCMDDRVQPKSCTPTTITLLRKFAEKQKKKFSKQCDGASSVVVSTILLVVGMILASMK